MFQLEKINDLFNCNVCKGVLVDPIILPCGETVCKAHTDPDNYIHEYFGELARQVDLQRETLILTNILMS
jgi:hypothetical protein